MLRKVSLGLGVAIVLADGAIVSLALPRMLVDLHTTVVGVAAVLFVYMAVLAGSVWLGVRYASRVDLRQLVCGGFALVALAGLLCALANSLGVMLLGRVLGATGGGVAAVGAFGLIDGAGTGRRAWLLASVIGTMVGPALGGVLTQLFDWRSIFVVQIPFAAVAGAGALFARGVRSPVSGSEPRERFNRVAAAAAGLVSAALSAVLFLLVLMIITGWDISPLRAAVAVSVLPVAALFGVRVRASPQVRLVAGCVLIGAGILALAWLPEPTIAWTLAPQALAGFGAGMAMPALGGELLPQDTARQAAGLLSIRHAAIALTLVAVAPVIAHQLTTGVREAQLKGIALVLDAKLSPAQKFRLAPPLFAAVQSDQPRLSLRAAFAAHRSSFSGNDLVAYDELASRSQDLLTGIVKRGFRPAFMIAGLLALLAGALSVLLLTGGVRRRAGAAPAAAEAPRSPRRMGGIAVGVVLAAAVAVPVGYAVGERALAPKPVALSDPCHGGSLPGSGGITGFLQDRALQVVDAAACKLHTTREELVLALADPAESDRFAASHGGINPHDILQPLLSLLNL